MPPTVRRTIRSGTGKGRGAPLAVVGVESTTGSSVTSGESTLQSVTLKAKTFFKNGQAVRFEARGHMAANGNNKLVKVYLGATEIFSTGTLTSNDKCWRISGIIMRTGADAQLCYIYGVDDTTNIAAVRTAAAVDDDSDQILAIKGTAGSVAADVTCEILTVETLNDPL